MKKEVKALSDLGDITVDECDKLYKSEGYAAMCNDGQLDGFVREEDLYRQKNKLKFIWLQ